MMNDDEDLPSGAIPAKDESPAEKTAAFSTDPLPPKKPIQRRRTRVREWLSNWFLGGGRKAEATLYNQNFHVIDLTFKLAAPAATLFLVVVLLVYLAFAGRESVLVPSLLIGVAGYFAWDRAKEKSSRRLRLVAIGAMGLSTIGLAAYVSAWGAVLAVFLVLGLMGYWLWRSLMIWRTTRIVLTSEVVSLSSMPPKLTFKDRSYLAVRLDDVSSVEPIVPWWLPKWLRCGHLVVDTPGQKDTDLNNLRFIRWPEELGDMIEVATSEMAKGGNDEKDSPPTLAKLYRLKPDPNAPGEFIIQAETA